MNFEGLDGKQYKFKPNKRRSSKNSSKLHQKARDILYDFFPCFTILEEVRCFGTKKLGKTDLYADFFIVELGTIIEVHGKQHFEYTPFYHKSKLDFYQSQRRDKDKAEWCKINNLNLIILKYNEIDDWARQIKEN